MKLLFVAALWSAVACVPVFSKDDVTLYQITLSVHEGNPEGSVKNGTIKVLATVKLVTQDKRQAEYYYPCRPGMAAIPPAFLLRVRVKPEDLGDGKVRLSVEQENISANGAPGAPGVPGNLRRQSKEVKLDEGGKLDHAPSPNGRVWVEWTISKFKR